MKHVRVSDVTGLDEYAAVAHLAPAVRDLRSEGARVAEALRGRTVWMVNSAARGGGVAEMLPTLVGILRELGVRCEWSVMETERAEFFPLTKRIHNLLHDSGDPVLTRTDRELYESVCRENAEALLQHLSPGDVIVAHDPQPMGMARFLEGRIPAELVWRCHIGLDESTSRTASAWEFLEPYASPYRAAVFSAEEYVPGFLRDRSTVLHPSIDPLAPKNAELHLHRVVEVLANSGLAEGMGPMVMPPFPEPALRVAADGELRPAGEGPDPALLSRPVVTQISRWDRLKGWEPLLRAFAALKEGAPRGAEGRGRNERERRLALVRLVLAGPDPSSIQDDPEALEVFDRIRSTYAGLPPGTQEDVLILALPMASRERNALMVNALQRVSTLVVQNSLREGFGLTITEAMWKRIPVLSNQRACGPRQQVRDGVDGCLISDPEDPDEIRRTLEEMLRDRKSREHWGQSAQRRVHDEFLVFRHVARWGHLLAGLVEEGEGVAVAD